jgi:enamine deaminase RidA (YjgF/YER057c/UK114 family)
MTTTHHLALGPHGPVDGGRLLHEGDLAAQLALAVTNLEAALAGAGLDWTAVTRLRVSTTDAAALADDLAVLFERLDPVGAAPLVSVVEVPHLDVPGMAVALDGVAVTGPVGP